MHHGQATTAACLLNITYMITTKMKLNYRIMLLFWFKGIGVRVTAQQGIEIFHTTEIWAYRDVLYGTSVLRGVFRYVPGTGILLPGYISLRGCQVDIHIRSMKGFNQLIHVIFLKNQPFASFYLNLLNKNHIMNEMIRAVFSRGIQGVQSVLVSWL
jgi:hypothetical protein